MNPQVQNLFDNLLERSLPSDLSADTIESALQHFERKWLCEYRNPAECYEWVCSRFEIESSVIHTPSEIDRYFTSEILILMELYKVMEQFSHPDDVNTAEPMTSKNTDEGQDRLRKMTRVAEVLTSARNFILNASSMMSVADDETFERLGWEERVRTLLCDDEKKPHQVVILHLYKLLSQPCRRYRKYENYCYREILVEGEFGLVPTYAWKKECTITEFLYENITKDKEYSLWLLMTANLSTVSCISEYIEKSEDPDFPKLNYNENLFSFRNGILNVEQIAFYEFGREETWESISLHVEERMRGYDAYYKACPPMRDDATMNFFDEDFQYSDLHCINLFQDPSFIQCPELEKMLDDQRLESETIYWFFAMLGRLLFTVGKYDDWQLILFLKGVAGSGKSTISQLMKAVFDESLVGILSSEGFEGTFGLGPLEHKRLVICSEVKRNFKTPQGELQSMASGEPMSFAIKNKAAKTSVWTASLLFCGNEIPTWRDASGSMERRLFMIHFNYRIREVDTSLKSRMMSNLGNFLLRISLSYKQIVLKYGKQGQNLSLWSKDAEGHTLLPQQILDFRGETLLDIQPLMNYINNGGDYVKVMDIPDDEREKFTTFIPEQIFRLSFKAWCQQLGVQFPTWTKDMYDTAFQDSNIERVWRTGIVWDGQTSDIFILEGLGMKKDD